MCMFNGNRTATIKVIAQHMLGLNALRGWYTMFGQPGLSLRAHELEKHGRFLAVDTKAQ